MLLEVSGVSTFGGEVNQPRFDVEAARAWARPPKAIRASKGHREVILAACNEIEKLRRMQALDQRQCDDMTDMAGEIAVKLADSEAETERLRAVVECAREISGRLSSGLPTENAEGRLIAALALLDALERSA